MTTVLITSGPTRQYIDPIRYLTNASSGRMGAALAAAALAEGFDVLVVSGPVEVAYPRGATVHSVLTTEDMLAKALELLPLCDGVIGVAAACDYRPITVASHKLSKEEMLRAGEKEASFCLKLIETPDVMATLATHRRSERTQWLVGFALETNDHRAHALQKLQRKCCDLIVLNDSRAINSHETEVEIIADQGETVGTFSGTKRQVASGIMKLITQRLVNSEKPTLIEEESI
ncbi:MAG: phosphopantothenoylcysteine decarboxylase [Planctomycetia bacterium]|nr:phosphopantothenoylcysteine decarboxylase [Planctomycetia bacterium]